MRALGLAISGLALAAGMAVAQTRLGLPGGVATLPPGDWRVIPLADGSEAVRPLGPRQRLTARIVIEPMPAGANVADRLAGRMEALRQALMARKELVYFETMPLSQPGMVCLHAQSIRTEVPPYAVPGDRWSDYAVHRLCALPGGDIVVMLFAEWLGAQDPMYAQRDLDAQDFFDSFVPAAP